MAESSSSDGILPASESLFAFTITMKRIRSPPSGFKNLWRVWRHRKLKAFGSCARDCAQASGLQVSRARDEDFLACGARAVRQHHDAGSRAAGESDGPAGKDRRK